MRSPPFERLQIRKGEHEIRLKCHDLGNVSAAKCRNAWLLFSNASGSYGVARDAYNTRILFKKVKRLDRLLGQADDAFRRKGQLENNAVVRFDKHRNYAALENETSLRYGLTEDFRVSLGALFDYHSYGSQAGDDQR
jgi:hypothetical protein